MSHDERARVNLDLLRIEIARLLERVQQLEKDRDRVEREMRTISDQIRLMIERELLHEHTKLGR